jgi:8-oxo-dGTP diphosphatase
MGVPARRGPPGARGRALVSVTEPADPLEHPYVAVAVVTSRVGVLIGRRRDGNPPWTFPGGKIEAGESPVDAAVRETLEETGLQVRATGVSGSRVHPVTGVRMVYVAAELMGEPGVMAAGSGELAEVRWGGLAEAEELMEGMSEEVRQHLALALGD